jgi:hypothetical protein
VQCVDLGLTVEIKAAVAALYTFLINSYHDDDSQVDQDDLAKLVHSPVAALLVGQGPSCKKVDGPFDYASLLAMYHQNGNFHEATRISRYCAILHESHPCSHCPTWRSAC